MRPIPVDETRPVLATDPRWTSDGVELELEKSILRVGDDSGRLRAVLDACDGSRRVREIASEFGSDARGLIGELLDAGALVDVEESWRRFHRLGGNPPPVAHAISDEEVAELMTETFVPSGLVGAAAVSAARVASTGHAATGSLSWRRVP